MVDLKLTGAANRFPVRSTPSSLTAASATPKSCCRKAIGLRLRDGLALLDALSMPIADSPDADAVLVGIEAQSFERFD